MEQLLGSASIIAISASAGAVVMGFVVAATLRRVVDTNMVHIVQSGKKTVSYGKGREAGNVYYEIPSAIPGFGVKVTVLPESNFNVSLRGFEAYDKGRLPFLVDIMGFFRIKDSDIAAHRVSSFDELEQQLVSILQGACRSLLASSQLETILEDRSGLGESFTQSVDGQLAEWGVESVKTIEFMDIKDAQGSQVIHQIMSKEQSRIDRESREAIAENDRAAQEKEIEAKRQVSLADQQAREVVGQRTAEADKAVGIATEVARQEVLSQEKTTAERTMEVQRVNDVKRAEIAKDVAKVVAEQNRDVAIVAADADRQQLVINADGTKQQTEIVAQGNLTQATLNAQGIQAEGEARAAAEKAMQLAPVEAQIVLAKEIGSNEGYQDYLIGVKQIEGSVEVGKSMAGALSAADLKIIANSGDVISGTGQLADVLNAGGGTRIAALLEGLAQTDAGKALVKRITGRQEDEGSVVPPAARQTGRGAVRRGLGNPEDRNPA